MAIIKGCKQICLIQGATKDLRFRFNEETTQIIESVLITCKDLDLNIQLLKTESGEFTYRLEADTTASFPTQTTSYDMTVTFTDGSVGIQTAIPFIVKTRENPPIEEDD